MAHLRTITLLIVVHVLACAAPAQLPAPRAYRADHAVLPVSTSTVIAEAEEFRVESAGWQALPWGANYYAATLANTFLSRKAFLGAAEQANHAVASIVVRVPARGRYLALVRYEAAPRFQTQFRLRVEQAGRVKLDRLYGARENVKIWAFRQKLKPEAFWSWGAVENIVWEGHDAFVELEAGDAKLTLLAEKQPEPAAKRNIDLVMLTSDVEQVKTRIEKEDYLPLDGMLTQSGDIYLKLHNDADSSPMVLNVPPGTEHSPYWVHMRRWQAREIPGRPGESSDWVEVGSLLDTLNDGQWRLSTKAEGAIRYSLEFGLRKADGTIESICRIENLRGNVDLAYAADTRYSRHIGTADQVLYDLVDYLKKQPVHGTPPRRTLVYGYTFERRPKDARYNAALNEFIRLTGATALVCNSDERIQDSPGLVRGYIDVRDKTPQEVEQICRKLQADGRADKIAVVSLGDEIGLQQPPGKDHASFQAWLRQRGLKPSDVDPAAGDDWSRVLYSPDANPAAKPGLYYYSRVYQYRYGIQHQKALTDVLRHYLPNAGIGANYSPHHGHLYIGQTAQWISLFREEGMTMPWSEDYIWQPPVGTQQMNFISLDTFRAGIAGKPQFKIHMYVMPHWPGNTPASWRRQFYGAIGHGAKILNLFEFRPVQAAYTENHVSLPEMYQEVRQGLHELGQFEDIVQDGQVRRGLAALWFSETGDIWDSSRHPFDAAKRTLYIAIRHQQLPLDIVTDGDDLNGYRVLYLTDQHITRSASAAIAQWVADGGRLFATAGAGMFDEFNRPNTAMRELLGIERSALQEPKQPVRREKEDLPFAQPIDTVLWQSPSGVTRIPVIDVRSPFSLIAGSSASVEGRFADGSPAIATRTVGKGLVVYCGFLPGLSYFKPALPLRPADRGTSDDSMAHFIPTHYDMGASTLVALPARDIPRPITCSNPLVESTVIQSQQGTLVTLINWSGKSIQGLKVEIGFDGAKNASLATGRPVRRQGNTCVLDLDVADALILR